MESIRKWDECPSFECSCCCSGRSELRRHQCRIRAHCALKVHCNRHCHQRHLQERKHRPSLQRKAATAARTARSTSSSSSSGAPDCDGGSVGEEINYDFFGSRRRGRGRTRAEKLKLRVRVRQLCRVLCGTVTTVDIVSDKLLTMTKMRIH